MSRKVRELRDKKVGLSRPVGQFSLHSLFMLMLFSAIAILAIRELHFLFGPAATAVVILASLSVMAHVAGAVIGGRLRASNDALGESVDTTEDTEVRLIQPIEAQQTDFAPATELSRQRALQRRPIYFAIGIGAFLCSVAATIVLVWFMWDRLRIVNVVFGAVCAAVIGSILGFCVGSFVQVIRSALAEAQQDPPSTNAGRNRESNHPHPHTERA